MNADKSAICAPELVEVALASSRALALCERPMVLRLPRHLFMARVCPVTMTFLPCRNGWSHRPDEFASLAAIATGVATLGEALRRLAA